MVLVLNQRLAVFGNARVHELADEATEVCRHYDGFQARQLFVIQAGIYESEEVEKVCHCPGNVRGR